VKVLLSGRFDARVVDGIRKHWDVEWIGREPTIESFWTSEDELIEKLRSVDVLVTEGDPVTNKVVSACPQLKVVVPTRGNPVNVDVQAATEHGVMVVNTPGRNKLAVTELSIALMVMIARNIAPALEGVKTGRWAKEPGPWAYINFQGFELAGARWVWSSMVPLAAKWPSACVP